MKPIAIDLFCGLGGWAEEFLAEGYDVIGFDIEARPYPGQLVIQDVLTLHGCQFKNAAAIVASPPCQEFSYMAMPWSRGKQIQDALECGNERFPEGYDGSRTVAELTALFDACFRIQREAIEATCRDCPACGGKGFMVWYVGETHTCERCEGKGFVFRHIPLVVENVKGAQPWVGPARAHFGSFYLWGDIDSVGGSIVAGGVRFGNVLRPAKRGRKVPGMSWSGSDQPGYKAQGFNTTADQRMREEAGQKNGGGSWFAIANNTESGHGQNPDGRLESGVKCGGSAGDDWFAHHNRSTFPGVKQHGSGPEWFDNGIAKLPSGSSRRKLASAKIAMIPPPLARHIAACFKPPL